MYYPYLTILCISSICITFLLFVLHFLTLYYPYLTILCIPSICITFLHFVLSLSNYSLYYLTNYIFACPFLLCTVFALDSSKERSTHSMQEREKFCTAGWTSFQQKLVRTFLFILNFKILTLVTSYYSDFT